MSPLTSSGIACGVSRIRRGGCWSYSAANCRVSMRGRIESWHSWGDNGFRLVCPAGR